ncbi:major facilitator superfamily domain-containing protein [Hyaloraphidium curvatum]|nr:major facilitator superfamily domain-containing protein [Hyaloraphidium curvatum]
MAEAGDSVQKPEDGDTDADTKVPLDGLRAWTVAVGAFIVHVVVLGIGLAFGLVQKEILLTSTGADATAGLGSVSNLSLSLVASLSVGCITIFGVVAGFLTDRLGPRPVGLAGSLFCGAGLVSGSFCSQVWQLYLTYSLLFGIGSAMTIMPSMAATSVWFSPGRRNIPLAFTVSGTGVGGLVMSWITQVLLDGGGWRFTFRVQGGIATGLLLFSFLCIRGRRTETATKETDGSTVEEPQQDPGRAADVAPPSEATNDGVQLPMPAWNEDGAAERNNAAKEDHEKHLSIDGFESAMTPRPNVPRFMLKHFSPFFVATLTSVTFNLTYLYVFLGAFTIFVPQQYVALAISDTCPTCTSSVGAAMVSIISGVLALGRILIGVLATFIGLQNAMVFSLFMCTVAMAVWLPFANDQGTLAPLYAMSAIWGLFSGGVVVSAPSTASYEIDNIKRSSAVVEEMRDELLRGENSPARPKRKQIAGLATLIGWLYTAFAAGDLFGPAIAGAIVDAGTTYDPVTGQRLGTNWTGMILYVMGSCAASMAVALSLRLYTSRKLFVKV